MPISGDLNQFPLPEVLLLIGTRTGRLRLYDVPEFGIMELDLAEGNAEVLHIGGIDLIEHREIVTQLSVIIGTGEGKFEFCPRPVVSFRCAHPLTINKLVMLMVLYVDEVLDRQQALPSDEPIYAVQSPVPEMWIDPNLNLFFDQCKHLLAEGARCEDIAAFLGMKDDDVRLNLTYLRQLGFVQLLDGAAFTKKIRVEQDVSYKSNEFQIAAEASDLIRRTGKLLKIPLQQRR
jgi:hypothetical protein